MKDKPTASEWLEYIKTREKTADAIPPGPMFHDTIQLSLSILAAADHITYGLLRIAEAIESAPIDLTRLGE